MSESLISRINARIALQTAYGYHTERAMSRGYLLYWSNASAKWNRAYYLTKKGESVVMDANVIFVPLTQLENKTDIDAVLKQLKQLPLFRNSFEVVYQGAKVS